MLLWLARIYLFVLKEIELKSNIMNINISYIIK